MRRFRPAPLLVLCLAAPVAGGCHRVSKALDEPARAEPELLRAQREVWESWYAGDTARFRELTPGLIAINNGGGSFGRQDAALRASAQFHARGGRLLELSFPELLVQRFGDVVIVYSTYRSVFVLEGDTLRESGRATEVFVRRHGEWVNPGWHLDSGT
jgi:hypothetical protein